MTVHALVRALVLVALGVFLATRNSGLESNRLFTNVGIGRETQSLMMMVTPRIIIQEEEEAKLLESQP